MDKIVKVILAILLLLCLLDMPYGFYQLVRFITFVGFALLAITARQKERQTEVIIFIGLALLFQPFFKVALGRSLWNIVDVITAAGLLISIWFKSRSFGQYD